VLALPALIWVAAAPAEAGDIGRQDRLRALGRAVQVLPEAEEQLEQVEVGHLSIPLHVRLVIAAARTRYRAEHELEGLLAAPELVQRLHRDREGTLARGKERRRGTLEVARRGRQRPGIVAHDQQPLALDRLVRRAGALTLLPVHIQHVRFPGFVTNAPSMAAEGSGASRSQDAIAAILRAPNHFEVQDLPPEPAPAPRAPRAPPRAPAPWRGPPACGALRALRRVPGLLAEQRALTTQCLCLPEPTLDLLGRPVWEVSVEDISKAYRKLARFCHPDKVSGMSDDEAKQAERAYETLRLAKECLSKEDSRGPYVREHCQFLRPDKSALEIRSDDITGSIERCARHPVAPGPRAVQRAGCP